ncbi:hypothetical protein [Polynucleobacter necessarius]|uniref:hypothetical protein n=1 Tax=Polynucleobacter necessarius TaxID=576610 RepID=UPI0018D5768C|nr:hypothetical protein [Polynucleobacter necessarius]
MHAMLSFYQPFHILLASSSIFGANFAHAQSALYNATNSYLKKRADAVMTITGYSLTPDVTTTGSLSIRH